MNLIENILFGILFLIMGFVAFILVDGALGKSVYYTGIVIDKHYESEHNGVGIGSAVGANGQVGVITTTEHDPERFLLMVKKENGKIVTTESEPELYYEKQIGDTVYCLSYSGKWSGWEWNNTTIK